MAEIAADTMLGRFRVLGVLGRGGMATVYLAEDTGSGERVALKLLHPHLAADPAARRRLAREVAVGTRIDHPGILTASELFEDGGRVGLVMPVHAGRTLAERVAAEGALPAEQVARVGRHLAEALGAAHRAGVLHRDVSARNVMLDDRGAAVLTDLGLARLDDGAGTRGTALLGTAGFVAPEILGGERAEPRSDLYGLGAVLYLAATGEEPFAAAHPQAALRKQLAGEVVPIAAKVPGFPTWLDALVSALLDPDPARRPRGAAEVVAAIEERRAPDAPGAAAASGAAASGAAASGAAGRAGGVAASGAAASGAAASGAVRVQAALPAGAWTVVVRDDPSKRDARKARRALQRRARAARTGSYGRGLVADATRAFDQAVVAIDAIAGAAAGPSTEARLAAAVAEMAGLPPAALREAPALERDELRLLAHVDEPTAKRAADAARALGLSANVFAEGRPDGLAGWLLARWWATIPLLWVLGTPLLALAPLMVFVFVAITVAIATIVGPWAERQALPDKARSLPVAYTPDLAPHLAEGYAAAEPVRDAQEPTAAAGTGAPASERRAATLAAEALAALDALDAAARAHPDLPAPVRADLCASAADLRREVADTAEDAVEVEAALSATGPASSAAWAADRLARLDTLARGGAAVDPVERERLTAAVAAHEAAVASEQALEARLTAGLARLLEVGATARRLRRELALERGATRPPEKALGDLRERAAAAAAARRELAGR